MNGQVVQTITDDVAGRITVTLANLTEADRKFVTNFVALMCDPRFDAQRRALKEGKTCIVWAGNGALHTHRILEGGASCGRN